MPNPTYEKKQDDVPLHRNQPTLAQPDRITLPHDPKPPLVRRAGDATKLAHPQPPPPPQRRKPLDPVRPVYKPLPSPRVATKRPIDNDPVHKNSPSNDEDDVDWWFGPSHKPTPEAWDAFEGQLNRFVYKPEGEIWHMKHLPPTLTNKNRRIR